MRLISTYCFRRQNYFHAFIICASKCARHHRYAFFQTILQKMRTPDPEEDPSLINELVPMPALIATQTGSVVDDLHSRTIHDLNVAYTTANVASVRN